MSKTVEITAPAAVREAARRINEDLYSGPLYLDEQGETCYYPDGIKSFYWGSPLFDRDVSLIQSWADDHPKYHDEDSGDWTDRNPQDWPGNYYFRDPKTGEDYDEDDPDRELEAVYMGPEYVREYTARDLIAAAFGSELASTCF